MILGVRLRDTLAITRSWAPAKEFFGSRSFVEFSQFLDESDAQ